MCERAHPPGAFGRDDFGKGDRVTEIETRGPFFLASVSQRWAVFPATKGNFSRPLLMIFETRYHRGRRLLLPRPFAGDKRGHV